MDKMITGLLASAAPLLVVACASGEVSTQRMTDTRAALQAAERVGADADPQASLFLTYAKEQMARAQSLSEQGSIESAELMLQRAEADAELAMVMAQEAEVRRDVEATLERIRALQNQARM